MKGDPMKTTKKSTRNDPMAGTGGLSLTGNTVAPPPHTPKKDAGAGAARGRPFGPYKK